MNLMIFGSCVSRDALEYDESKSIKLIGYYARSSMVSLFSSPCVDTSVLDRIESSFQRKMVQADMDKSFQKAIKRPDVDLLLIDFIEERFALQKVNGGYRTISAEYKKASAPISMPSVRPFTEERLALWKLSFNHLIDLVGATPFKINKVFWSRRVGNGMVMDHVTEEQVECANHHLAAMYKHVADRCGEQCFIDYDPSMFFCEANHKWGLSPFHYNRSLYEHTIASLL
jgi:hypothetical protein